METINRQDIKNAEYNPRIIDQEAKERLRKGLEEHGLVSALVYNKRTGNLVGGHQRLAQLDTLEDSKDYSLDVCVIDVDPKEEAVINVQLNNPSMQGEWDLDKLKEIKDGFDLDFSDMGFSDLDVQFMFDESEIVDMFDSDGVKADKERIQEIRDHRRDSMEKMTDENMLNWYCVLVFADEEEKLEFLKEIKVNKFEMYLTKEQVYRLKSG